MMCAAEAPESLQNVIYTVDADDRITWVNDAWDHMARAGDAPEILSGTVVGTELWAHISDPTLRHLLRRIFAKVRASRRPLELCCRCDAPEVRRGVEVRLESADGAEVRVTNRTISQDPRALTLSGARSDTLLKACGWCNAILVDGEWVEIEVAIERLRLLNGPHYPSITHGLCLSCADTLRTAGD